MQGNVGGLDRFVRIGIGAALFSLFLLAEGKLRLFGLIGLIPLYTGLLGNCSLYCILGISTRKGAAAGTCRK
jgi:hypothetical protein